jgi:hypothetical protein
MLVPQIDAPAVTTIIAQIHAEVKSSNPHFIRDGLSVAVPDAIASIVKLPPPVPPAASDASFAQLPCSEIDRQKITRLITVMGENGKLVLLLKYQRELRQIGREIDHVHPLKFLSTVFSNPSLKGYMREIYKDYFKWTNFMDGLGDGLTAQNKQGKVSPFIADFAKEVGVKPESLQGYVQSQDWENMVVYLMNN